MIVKIGLSMLGVGFLLFGLWALVAPASMATIFQFDLAAIMMGGVASARVFGLIVDSSSATFLYGALALEIAALSIALYGLRKLA